jgi:hypothetical protein
MKVGMCNSYNQESIGDYSDTYCFDCMLKIQYKMIYKKLQEDLRALGKIK